MRLDDPNIARALGRPSRLGELLEPTVAQLHRFIVLSPVQAIALALWIAHTHAVAAADCTPYIHATSAEKRSGKTRLLEVLEPLVAKPWRAGRVTSAVLARKISKEQPTLLLDEVDAAFKSGDEYMQTVRGILDAGYTRGNPVTLCVGQGSNISYVDLDVFSPKAFAGIGPLPDTIADRSIRIELERKRRSEQVARFRRREHRAELEKIRQEFASWVTDDVLETLAAARPELPEQLSDRAQDVWEPLLAIADLAGGDWPRKGRRASIALSGEGQVQDESQGVQLLTGIRAAFDERDTDRIPTRELAEFLAQHDEAVFGHLWHDEEGTRGAPKWIAKRLKPFGIHSVGLRTDDGRTPKGYKRESLEDAFARYLPSQPPQTQHATPRNGFGDSQDPPPDSPVADAESPEEPLVTRDVADVARVVPQTEGSEDGPTPRDANEQPLPLTEELQQLFGTHRGAYTEPRQ